MARPRSRHLRTAGRALALAAATGAALVAGIGAAAAADPPIPAFEAEYQVKYGRLTLGESRLELSYPEPGQYRYEMYLAPRGLARAILGTDLTDISEGRVADDGALVPERFIHKREGRDERHEETRFDREAERIHFPDAEAIALEDGAVDRLLPQLLIMRDLAETFDQVLAYRIADDGEISEYRFERQGRERVSVPFGSQRAERLQRVREGDSDRESNAWVYPRMSNLPLKIEHIADGRTFVMELKEVSGPITD